MNPRTRFYVGLFAAVGLLGLGWGAVVLRQAHWEATEETREARASEAKSGESALERSGGARVTEAELRQLVGKTRETLARYAREDAAEVETAIERMGLYFEQYRLGIPDFVEELYSLKSKAKTLRYLSEDKWNGWVRGRESHRVEAYIEDLWAKHFDRRVDLREVIPLEVRRLTRILEARRNRMLLEIDAHIEDLDRLGELEVAWDRGRLDAGFAGALYPAASASARGALGAEVLSLVGGEASAFAALHVARSLIRSTTASVSGRAVAAAVAGSSMSGGVILMSGWTTLGIGIVVGILVDYGITQIARTKMENRLHESLTSLEEKVMEGEAGEAGLKALLNRALRHYHRQKHEAIAAALRREFEQYADSEAINWKQTIKVSGLNGAEIGKP